MIGTQAAKALIMILILFDLLTYSFKKARDFEKMETNLICICFILAYKLI